MENVGGDGDGFVDTFGVFAWIPRQLMGEIDESGG
jgi:hypothetical protein